MEGDLGGLHALGLAGEGAGVGGPRVLQEEDAGGGLAALLHHAHAPALRGVADRLKGVVEESEVLSASVGIGDFCLLIDNKNNNSVIT